jgi:hypothetical protein
MKLLTASLSTRKIDGATTDAARSDSPWGLPDRAGCALRSWPLPVRPPVLPDERPRLRWARCGGILAALAGLCALVHWGACPFPAARPLSAEFCLQADASSFKLNNTSAGALRPAGPSGPALPSDTIKRHKVRKKPPSSEEPPLQLAEPLPKEPGKPKETPEPPPAELLIAPPEGALPEKPAPPAPAKDEQPVVPLDPPRPVEAPNLVVPVAAAELAPMCSYAHCVLHQGDIPMTRTWKTFGLQAVLAAALVAAPTAGNAAPEDRKLNGKDLAKRIKALEDQIKQLKEKDLKRLNDSILSINEALSKVDVIETNLKTFDKNVGTDMARVKKDLKELKESFSRKTTDPDTKKEIDEIKASLEKINRKLEVLRPDVSVRRYPPPSEMGRVLLVNRYPEEITFVVNGASYRLAPGASRLIDGVPAGSFTYEVFSPSYGKVGGKTSTLLPNETNRIVVDLP